jgi:hypothetical protein
MFRLGALSRALRLAAVAFAIAAVEARADSIIRVTSETSSGTVLGQQIATLSLSNPPPSAYSQTATFTAGTAVPDFSVVVGTNVATTAGSATSHSLTVNITYNGTGTGASSDMLIVEFLGTNFVHPLPGPASITSNGSPSTSGLAANSLTMISGVNNANGGLPATPGSTAGLSGTTTSTGSIGSASSVLVPNPATGAVFSIANPFSFYQAFTFSGFTNTNQAGSVSAGSTVASTIPEPSAIVIALTAVPFVGVGAWLRRRNRRATV